VFEDRPQLRVEPERADVPFETTNEQYEAVVPEPSSPKAFTDRPDLGRKPGWVYVPSRPPKEDRELQRLGPPPEKYAEYMTPDYSNRHLFEEHVFQEIGGNPFKMNPREAIQYANEDLPDLFERFFQGTIVWEDRGKLTREQAGQWHEVVKNYHAWALDAAIAKKKLMTEQYNFSMNQFDHAWREYQANIKRYRDKVEESGRSR
jgi:hypothetical protein